MTESPVRVECQARQPLMRMSVPGRIVVAVFAMPFLAALGLLIAYMLGVVVMVLPLAVVGYGVAAIVDPANVHAEIVFGKKAQR